MIFDLPVTSVVARRAYTQFRKDLLKDGFIMIQYSIYVRPCSSAENLDVHAKRVKRVLPPDGEVRILAFTDKQYERMKVFYGKKKKAVEKPPEQLEFF